ncbi:hypothetical protein C8J56DRAFT_895019 [Mycena floridula]|nr:hypothetical protein C8J56DRAFT_895019 [Mycena floridula]
MYISLSGMYPTIVIIIVAMERSCSEMIPELSSSSRLEFRKPSTYQIATQGFSGTLANPDSASVELQTKSVFLKSLLSQDSIQSVLRQAKLLDHLLTMFATLISSELNAWVLDSCFLGDICTVERPVSHNYESHLGLFVGSERDSVKKTYYTGIFPIKSPLLLLDHLSSSSITSPPRSPSASPSPTTSQPAIPSHPPTPTHTNTPPKAPTAHHTVRQFRASYRPTIASTKNTNTLISRNALNHMVVLYDPANTFARRFNTSWLIRLVTCSAAIIGVNRLIGQSSSVGKGRLGVIMKRSEGVNLKYSVRDMKKRTKRAFQDIQESRWALVRSECKALVKWGEGGKRVISIWKMARSIKRGVRRSVRDHLERSQAHPGTPLILSLVAVQEILVHIWRVAEKAEMVVPGTLMETVEEHVYQ